jgi:hypothetical protein
MSQLVKAITTQDTGERTVFEGFSPLFKDVFSAKSDTLEKYSGADGVAKAYRISVTLGSQVWVSELETLGNEDALSEAVARTKRQVIEAIFGEFRTDFMMIERALYDRDFQNARSCLTQFENKMFSDL